MIQTRLPRGLRPFADQMEWLDHRYDPGHFLGGTLRPELRLSLGARAKRAAAVLAFGSGAGVIALMATLTAEFGFVPEPYSLGLGALSLLVGRKMWRAANREAALDLPEETGRIYRVTLLASLATAVVALSGLGVVLLAAAVRAVMKGHMAIAASAVLILVVVALRRRGDLNS
jgi:hypothetical protein